MKSSDLSSFSRKEYENEGNRGGGEGLGGLGQKQVGQTLKNVVRWKFSLVQKWENIKTGLEKRVGQESHVQGGPKKVWLRWAFSNQVFSLIKPSFCVGNQCLNFRWQAWSPQWWISTGDLWSTTLRQSKTFIGWDLNIDIDINVLTKSCVSSSSPPWISLFSG